MDLKRSLLSGLVALLVASGLWFLVARPLMPQSPASGSGTHTTAGGTGTATASSAPTTHVPTVTGEDTGATTTPRRSTTTPPASSTSPGRPASAACRVGTPARLIIPALDVDAAFERIGLDQSAPPDADGRRPLGNPTDRTKAGWYAAGPRPGSGTGTVLTNGHTFRDNSAVFKEDFASRMAVGQRIDVRQDNGSLCSYRVDRLWREVNAKRDYPRIVTSQKLYDFSGPERLFLTTCGGSWNASTQNYDDISLLIATPVNRG